MLEITFVKNIQRISKEILLVLKKKSRLCLHVSELTAPTMITSGHVIKQFTER